MHLKGTWYGFTSSLTCQEKVSLKYSIPVNTLPHSPSIFNVAFALTYLLASMSCHAIN